MALHRKSRRKAPRWLIKSGALVTALLLSAGVGVTLSTPAFANGNSGNTNSASYWEGKFDHQASCYKHSGNSEHGKVTKNGKAVTLYGFNQSWPGDHWEALIVKGGSVDSGSGPGNVVYTHPSAGTDYFAPLNAGGQQSDVSHWIVCKGTTPAPPQLVASASVKVAPATCDVGEVASVDKMVNATLTSSSGTTGPGTYSFLFGANANAKFAGDKSTLALTGSLNGPLTGPECDPPFDWDWEYAAPTCTALTVVYPGNIPSGQANDVNIKFTYGPDFSQTKTLNFHNNSGTWSGTKVFNYADHPDFASITGKYRVTWVQVAGTNYHWQGSVECGEDVVIPKDAVASVSVTPATCDSPGKATFDITNASWDGPAVLKDGAYTRTATADAGHQFSDGTTKAKVTYQLEDILDPNAPPCYTETIKPCVTTTDGGVSTNLDPNGWTFNETRSTGHNDYVDGGLHVWTEGNTSTDKAAGYKSLVIPFDQVGSPEIEFASYTGVRPSVQIGFDKDGNGTRDGYLVYEPWAYGEGNWWSSKDFGVGSGMGYASFGTLDEYLQANPDAKTVNFGYTLGSGVKGDAVITSITMGCAVYTFDHEVTVLPSNPKGEIEASCGAAKVSVSNPFTPAKDTVGTDATFTVEVDGVVVDTVTIAPGGAAVEFGYTFNEDSGDHTVKVFSDGKLIDSAVVSTDCEANEVPGNPHILFEEYCSGVTFTFMYPATIGDNEFATPKDFHYTDENGDVQTVTMEANDAPVVRSVTFGEDTGSHEVKVWIGNDEPAVFTVETNCEPTIVTEFAVPTAKDACGVSNDKLDIPKDTDEVSYKITKDTRVLGVGSVTIEMSAVGDHELKEGVVKSWTFKFTNELCPTKVPPAGTGLDEAGVSPANAGLGVTGIALLAAGLIFGFGAFALKRRRLAVQ